MIRKKTKTRRIHSEFRLTWVPAALACSAPVSLTCLRPLRSRLRYVSRSNSFLLQMSRTEMEAGEMDKFCREMFAVPFSQPGKKKLEFAGGPRTLRAMVYSNEWQRGKEERTVFNWETAAPKLTSRQKKLVAPLARDAREVERRQDLLEATVACFSDRLRSGSDGTAAQQHVARAGNKAKTARKLGALVQGKTAEQVDATLQEQLKLKFKRMDEHTLISNSERTDLAQELVAAEAGRLKRGSDPRATLASHLAALADVVGPEPSAPPSTSSASATTPAPPVPPSSKTSAAKHHQLLGSSVSDDVLQCFPNPPAGCCDTRAWLSDDAMRFYGKYLSQYVVPGLDDTMPAPRGGVSSAFFIEGGNLEMFLPAHYQETAAPREEAMKLMASWSKEWKLKSRSHIFIGIPDRFFDPHGPYDPSKAGQYTKAISSHWAMLVYDRTALLRKTGEKPSFHYFDSLHPKVRSSVLFLFAFVCSFFCLLISFFCRFDSLHPKNMMAAHMAVRPLPSDHRRSPPRRAPAPALARARPP